MVNFTLIECLVNGQVIVAILILSGVDFYCRRKRDWNDGIRKYNRDESNMRPRMYTSSHFWAMLWNFFAIVLIGLTAFTFNLRQIITDDNLTNYKRFILITSIPLSMIFFISRIPAVYSMAIYIRNGRRNVSFFNCLDNKLGAALLILFGLILVGIISINLVYLIVDDKNTSIINKSFDNWWIKQNGWFCSILIAYITFLFSINIHLWTKSVPFAVNRTSMNLGPWGFWQGFRKLTFGYLYFFERILMWIVLFVQGYILFGNSKNNGNDVSTFWKITVPLCVEFWAISKWFATPSNRPDADSVPKLYNCWNKFWYGKAVNFVKARDPQFVPRDWEPLQCR